MNNTSFSYFICLMYFFSFHFSYLHHYFFSITLNNQMKIKIEMGFFNLMYFLIFSFNFYFQNYFWIFKIYIVDTYYLINCYSKFNFNLFNFFYIAFISLFIFSINFQKIILVRKEKSSCFASHQYLHQLKIYLISFNYPE